MKKIFSFVAVLLFATSILTAQQATLNNDSIVKLAKAGLSDDVIIATVNASAGSYNTSPDSLIAFKKAGVSDKVIAAIVQKSLPTQSPMPSAQTMPPPVPAPTSQIAQAPASAPPAMAPKPRVFLTAQNSANSWGAILHNQAAEMTKDFGESCSTVIVTVNQQNADYTVSLNHVEAGFYRDNQLSAADRNGDVIAPPVKYESIAKGVKRACDAMTSDWTAKYDQPLPPPPPASASK
jgi:hypothetical protein